MKYSLSQKAAAKSRDNNTCQKCGETKGRLHVHHIKPSRLGGTDELDNLITLCPKCHSGEDMKISPRGGAKLTSRSKPMSSFYDPDLLIRRAAKKIGKKNGIVSLSKQLLFATSYTVQSQRAEPAPMYYTTCTDVQLATLSVHGVTWQVRSAALDTLLSRKERSNVIGADAAQKETVQE